MAKFYFVDAGERVQENLQTPDPPVVDRFSLRVAS
jgi:hypothetical protein